MINHRRERQLRSITENWPVDGSGIFSAERWSRKLIKNLYQSTVFGEIAMKEVNGDMKKLAEGPPAITIRMKP